MDRAYIDYEKLEILTQREGMYVTKMKKILKYNIMEDCMYQTTDGLMEVRIQHVALSKVRKGGETLTPVSLPMPIPKGTNWLHCLKTTWNQSRTKLYKSTANAGR